MTAMITARNSRRTGIRPAGTVNKPVQIHTQPTPAMALDQTMQDCYEQWPYCNQWEVVSCDQWTADAWLDPQVWGVFESDPVEGVNTGNPGPDEYDV